MLHLAIFAPGYIDKIFNGQKTIDGRFSLVKCLPFNGIEPGDLVLMKKTGGHIIGYFVAGRIQFMEDLNPQTVKRIIGKYKNELSLSEDFISKKLSSRYVTLIEILKPTKFRMSVTVRKRNLSAWIRLGGDNQNQIQLF